MEPPLQRRLANGRRARRLTPAIAGALCVLATAVTLPAPAAEVTIVPNQSIGKVRLGMTLRQVEKAIGPPDVANARKQINGHGYIEYGWQFSTFWVGFANHGGRLRAVLIGTNLKGQETSAGVGNGSTLDALRAHYDVACRNVSDGQYDPRMYKDPGEFFAGFCVLGALSAPTTVFAVGCTQRPPGGGPCRDWRIYRVIVRRANL